MSLKNKAEPEWKLEKRKYLRKKKMFVALSILMSIMFFASIFFETDIISLYY